MLLLPLKLLVSPGRKSSLIPYNALMADLGMTITLWLMPIQKRYNFKFQNKSQKDCEILTFGLCTTSSPRHHPRSVRIRMGRGMNYLWRTIKDRIDFW